MSITIGHYRVEEQLGKGGMGTVYRAVDIRLGRPVAVKFLREELAVRPDILERFGREAKAISALNHPNICTLYDIGEDAGRPYLVMEYLEGMTMADRQKQKAFTADELIAIGGMVTSALEAAHFRGMVHRDIKPSNIYLLPNGQAKVLDFGIAKRRQMEPASLAAAADTPSETVTVLQQLTLHGSVAGTVAYMSPEQLRGEPVDARSDVFSLGATLYEMATGKLAFPGNSVSEIAASLMQTSPVPPQELRPDITASLSRVILTALEKDRHVRYQTAAEMGAALHAAGQPAAKPRRKSQILFAGALVASLAAAGVFVYRRAEIEKLPRFQHIEMRRLTSGGNARSAAISPDGRYLAYSTGHDGVHSLRIKQIANNGEVEVVPPSQAEFRNLVFSPDGNLLYFGANIAGLFAIPTLGGQRKLINSNVDGAVTFSPDGKQIAFVRNFPRRRESAIFAAAADGSGERRIATRTQPKFFSTSTLSWSPDGKTLICAGAMFSPKGQVTTIIAIPANGGAEKVITDKQWFYVTDVKWLNHGRGVVAIGEDEALNPMQSWYVPYPGGKAERITNDLNSYSGLAFTSDATAMATVLTERKSNLWVSEGLGPTEATQITSGDAKLDGLFGLSWTPDGRIVYSSRANGEWEIWIAGADGSQAHSISPKAIQPRVSPNGKYIVFSTDRNAGEPHIWRMEMDGDHAVQLTSAEGEHQADCCIGDHWVVYSRLGPNGNKLWKIPLEGGPSEPLAEGFLRSATISPDSAFVACNFFSAPPPLPRGVAILRAQGGVIEKRFDIQNEDQTDIHGDYRPMFWRADSKAFYFLHDEGGVSNIWEQPLNGKPPVQASHFLSGRIFAFAISRDGKRLALAKGSLSSDVILLRNVP